MNRDYPVIDVVRTGQKIKCLMQENELTVKDLQRYLHLSTPQAVYHWFDGMSLPSLDNFYALSKLLHVSVDSMIVETGKIRQLHPHDAMAKRIYLYYRGLMRRSA